jgi:hypothetical protein
MPLTTQQRGNFYNNGLAIDVLSQSNNATPPRRFQAH